jgi:Response regulator receiver domain
MPVGQDEGLSRGSPSSMATTGFHRSYRLKHLEWEEVEVTPDMDALRERALHTGARGVDLTAGGGRLSSAIRGAGGPPAGSRDMTIGVLVADDEEVVRTGLRLILESEEDVRVVAEAGDGREAVEAVRRTRPDVALMGIRMPHLDGIAATRQPRATDFGRVLILTTFGDDEYL